MRKWIDAVNVLNEGFFDFLKGGNKEPISAKKAAQPGFGKRKEPLDDVDLNKLKAALDEIGPAVAWGGIAGSKDIILQAATKYGVPAGAIRQAITPEVLRNWQRRY